jgi:hypothetical protein
MPICQQVACFAPIVLVNQVHPNQIPGLVGTDAGAKTVLSSRPFRYLVVIRGGGSSRALCALSRFGEEFLRFFPLK